MKHNRQIVIHMIWGLLNDLSVIMDLSMVAVPVPGIASLIQSTILNFIYLDILQTSSWLVPYLSKKNADDDGVAEEDTVLNAYFDNSGFSSMNMLKNLGSTLVYLVLYVALIIIYYLVSALGTFSIR
jgi:hypothetical protein